MGLPSTLRQEAKRLGHKFYQPDRPCAHGHSCLRYVSNGACAICSAIQSTKWYSNPENYRAKNKRSWAKHREYHKKRHAKWKRENPEIAKECTRAWRRNNKEHFQAKQKEWFKANPERRRVYINSYRARKRNSSGSHTVEDIISIFKSQHGMCAYCRAHLGSNYRVDHIKALKRGGSNDRRNLQILCQPCNSKKWMHDPVDFAQSLGLLL